MSFSVHAACVLIAVEHDRLHYLFMTVVKKRQRLLHLRAGLRIFHIFTTVYIFTAQQKMSSIYLVYELDVIAMQAEIVCKKKMESIRRKEKTTTLGKHRLCHMSSLPMSS